MKKLMILLMIATGFTSVATAQFGIKGGVNFANLAVDKDEIDDANTKVGFTAGIFIDIPILGEDFLKLRPEALYTTKGAKYSYAGGDGEVKANLHYVDIPVVLVLRLFGSPLTLHAGPQLSYLSKVKYEYDDPIFGESTVEDDDKGNFNTWDAGVVAGLGLEIENLTIEARAARGLQNVEEDHELLGQTIEANKTKNFGIMLTAGLRF